MDAVPYERLIAALERRVAELQTILADTDLDDEARLPSSHLLRVGLG